MKVVLAGDSAVGKTSIVNSILHKSTDNANPTINFAKADVTIKSSSGEDVSLCLWDTAGQECFQALAPLNARNSKVHILVFDVNIEKTFTNLQNWHEILMETSSPDYIFIVGNKIDLPEDQRQVSYEDANNFATQLNAQYNEVSAKTGDGINELFVRIADQLMAKKEEISEIQDPETVPIDTDEKQESSCCIKI